MKYLLAILIVWLIWRGFKALQRRPRPELAKTTRKQPEDMVQCRTCGVFLPRSQAAQLGTDDLQYRCPEHAPRQD